MAHVENCALSGLAGGWSWGRSEVGTGKVNKASKWSLANYDENLGNGTNCTGPVSLQTKNYPRRQ